MSRKLFWIIFAAIWVVVMPVAAWARIDVDSAVFRYDSTRVYWEIYYTIPRNQLTYVGAANNSFSSIVLTIAITSPVLFICVPNSLSTL